MCALREREGVYNTYNKAHTYCFMLSSHCLSGQGERAPVSCVRTLWMAPFSGIYSLLIYGFQTTWLTLPLCAVFCFLYIFLFCGSYYRYLSCTQWGGGPKSGWCWRHTSDIHIACTAFMHALHDDVIKINVIMNILWIFLRACEWVLYVLRLRAIAFTRVLYIYIIILGWLALGSLTLWK